MSEIKVDWSLAPKDATEIVKVALAGQKWRNPETKQYWSMNGDFGGYYSENSPIDEGSIFATRPQTKTVADEQEGEKWTHTWKGDKCRIVFTEGESSWINGHFLNTIVHNSSLKPIKPKLTESEMLERIKYRAISIDDDDEFGAKVRSWLDQYEII